MESLQAKFCAEQGVKLASHGDYKPAVECFTQAIAYCPNDYRLYVNRSYSLFYLAEYEKSLLDADQAIDLAEGTVTAKPMYRRALAQLALGQLEPALQSFEQVLRIDNTCPVSQEKRCQIRSSLLQAAGIPDQRANELAKGREPICDLIRGAEQQDIASLVRVEQTQDQPLQNGDDVHRSSGDFVPMELILCGPGDRTMPSSESPASSVDSGISVLNQVYNAMPDLLDMDPVSNPIGFHALTAGNIGAGVKRPALTELFSQFGELGQIYRLKGQEGTGPPSQVTVLVQYSDAESPVRAVEALRSAIFDSGFTADPFRPLELRLTASQDQKAAKFVTIQQAGKKCSDAAECFDWRGAGCFDEKCQLVHSRANHRLDSHSYFYCLNQKPEP